MLTVSGEDMVLTLLKQELSQKSIHNTSSYHKNLGSNPSHSPLDPTILLGQSRITSTH